MTEKTQAVNDGFLAVTVVRSVTVPAAFVGPLSDPEKLPSRFTVTTAPLTGLPRLSVTCTVTTPYDSPRPMLVLSEATTAVAVGGWTSPAKSPDRVTPAGRRRTVTPDR